MHSLRAKITMLTVSAIMVAIIITTAISTVAIKNLGSSTSDQILFLLCE